VPPLPRSLPRLLEHPSVGPVELALYLGATLGEIAHVACALTASLTDLAVDARELQLQALDLEHPGI